MNEEYYKTRGDGEVIRAVAVTGNRIPDDEGYLFTSTEEGRHHRRGYNIYPREVDEVLYQHQGAGPCVVGIRTYRGETVKAFVD